MDNNIKHLTSKLFILKGYKKVQRCSDKEFLRFGKCFVDNDKTYSFEAQHLFKEKLNLRYYLNVYYKTYINISSYLYAVKDNLDLEVEDYE